MLKTPLRRILLSGTLIATLVLLPVSLQAAPAAPAADRETVAVAGRTLALSDVVSWLLERWDGLWAEPSDKGDADPPQKAGCEIDPDGCPESSSTGTGSGGG